jgi:hypothetical protein
MEPIYKKNFVNTLSKTLLGTILSVTPAKLPIIPLATFVLELITPLDLMGLLEIVIFGFREGSLIMVPSGSFICPDGIFGLADMVGLSDMVGIVGLSDMVGIVGLSDMVGIVGLAGVVCMVRLAGVVCMVRLAVEKEIVLRGEESV